MLKKTLYLLTISLFFSLAENLIAETNIEWELMTVPDFVYKDAMESICCVDSLLFVGSVSGTIDSSGLYKYNLTTSQWGRAFVGNKIKYVDNIMRDEAGEYLYVVGGKLRSNGEIISRVDKIKIKDYTYTMLKDSLKNDVGWWGDVKDNGKNIALVGVYFYKVLYSIDYGITWQYSLIDSQATAYPHPRDVLFNKGVCYVASTDYFGNLVGGVYRSIDSCKTWQGPFVQNGAGALAVDSQDRIYLGIGGGPIYYSDNQFATWTNTGYGEEVNKIHVTRDDQVFAGLFENGGSHGGILYSPNRGISWSYQCQGLPENSSIVDITEDDNGYIYLIVKKCMPDGSYPCWLYRSKNSVSIENNFKVNKMDCGLSNYPNPFNCTTNISYNLQDDCQVNLAIYNTKGELVKELANEQQSSGFKQAVFDATGLNSGVFFVRIVAGDQTGMRKLILIK